MKSCSFEIVKVVISGFEITTFGFPPTLSVFASASPIVLETLPIELS